MAKNAEHLNLKINAGERKNQPCNLRIITLEKVIQFIDNKKIDFNTKKILKNSASKYPQQALENWVKNFDKHLIKARTCLKLNKPKTIVELGDEPLDAPPLSQSEQQQEEELTNAPEAEEF
jgi:hypothetical protein